MMERPTTASGHRGALQVAPAAVEFDEAEPGACFVAAFTVRNASARSLRFRLVPPALASPFKVLSRTGRDLARAANPTVQLPAGLTERFDVAFELPDDARDALVHDVLTIKGEDDSVIQVPLVARRAGPRLEVSPARCDLGLLVLEQRAAQYVELQNTGARPGAFEIEVVDGRDDAAEHSAGSSSSASIAVVPRRGVLEPSQSVHVKIEAVANALGAFRALVRARIWESHSTTEVYPESDDIPGGQNNPMTSRNVIEKVVDVVGTIVEHTVELVLQHGLTPVKTLDFGALFAGEKRMIETTLRNNGPQPLHFRISLTFGGLAASATSVGAGTSNTDDDRATYERKKELSVSPIEGQIEPFSQLPVSFVYSPRALDLEDLQRIERKYHDGANHQDSTTVISDEDGDSGDATGSGMAIIPPQTLNAFVSIQCADVLSQNLTYEVSGKVFLPRLSLSPSSQFDFGDIKSHDRADMILTIKNLSGLPIQFSMQKLAHYSVKPAEGRLDVLQSQNVVVSFTPTQLGTFRSIIQLIVNTNVLSVPISLKGSAAAVGDVKNRTIVGGIHALPKDFEPKYKFLLPDEARRTKGQLAHKFQRVPAYEVAALNGTAAIDEYEFEGTNNTHLTYCVKELSRRSEHKAIYNDYLTNSRLQRQGREKRKLQSALDLKDSIAKTRGQGAPDEEHSEGDVNLGMDRQGGIAPKPLILPPSLSRACDLLWLSRSAGGSGANKTKAFFDENKLIKKKFKPHPATQAELAECALSLDFDQLEQIAAGPKTINFGKISVNGVATKNLTVQNNLPQSVLVALNLEDQDNLPELAFKTLLTSQVVPPHATAGFDLVFSSPKEQFYQRELTYSINKIHTRQITIVAEVAPIVVELSNEEVVFEFGSLDLNPFISREVMLTNTSDSTAPFEWIAAAASSANSATAVTSLRPDSSKSNATTQVDKTLVGPPTSTSPSMFSIVPTSGQLDPGATSVCRIEFTPPSAPPTTSAALPPNVVAERCGDTITLTQLFQVNVTGGKSAVLTAKAVLHDVKVTVKEKKVDFGAMSAGIEKSRKITLTNQSASDGNAVYYATIEPPAMMSTVGLAVSPVSGCIICNESAELTLTMLAHRAVTLEPTTTLNIQIRGGKTLRIPVSADVIVPDVHVIPPSIVDFGDVIIGVSVPRVVTLENHSSIPACLVLDLMSSLSDEFLINTPAKLLARLEDASSIFAPIIDRSRAAPTDTSAAAADAEGTTTDSGASCSKWQINLPPNATVAFHLVFTPKLVRNHDRLFPIQFSGISGGAAAQPNTIKRRVLAQAIVPRLLFSSSSINFNRCVITREGIRKVPYTKILTLTNSESRPLRWQIDTSKLKLANLTGVVGPTAKRSGCTSATAVIFYIAPDKGELAPQEEVKVRVSFLPADPVEYSEDELPLHVDDQFYLNLTVRGEGIHPHLSFSESKVVLPTVPLGFTSRAKVIIQSTGYDHLELTHRVPLDTSKAPLTVEFPKGKVLSMACPTLPVEIRFCSMKSVAFSARIEFFDADGNAFHLPVAGCAENCLLTNYSFLQSNTVVQRSTPTPADSRDNRAKGVAADPSSIGFYTHNLGRFPVYLLSSAQIDAELDKQRNAQQSAQTSGFVVVDGSACLSDDIPPVSLLPKQLLSTTVGQTASPRYSEDEVKFMLQFLNANFLKVPVSKLPHDFANSEGKPLYEVLEMVCTKKPHNNESASKTTKAKVATGGSSGKAAAKPATTASGPTTLQSKREVLSRTTAKFSELIKFLKSYGAMVHDVFPEHLLSQEFYVAACEDPRADPSLLSSPALASMSFVQRRGILEREWLAISTNAWMSILYQVIKCFLLYRITPKNYQQQLLTDRQKDPDFTPQPERAFQGSNIYSESEMVLIQWICDHMRSKYRDMTPPAELQLLDIAHDLEDGRFLFNLLAAHIPTLSVQQNEYQAFQIVKQQRPLSATRLQQNAQLLLSALSSFGIDFGIDPKHFLVHMNRRQMTVLLLHLYQTLPQFIPKATIEFRGSLGQLIEKSIELRNPSTRPLRYEVFLDDTTGSTVTGGSQNALASAFTIEATNVTLEPGKTVAFVVTLRPRFSRKVTARLVFQSVRDRESPTVGPTGATMVFLLESNILSRKPVRIIQVEANTYEKKVEEIVVDNQFPANGSYKLSMIQSHRQHHGPPGNNSSGVVSGSAAESSLVDAFRGRKKSISSDNVAKGRPSAAALPNNNLSGGVPSTDGAKRRNSVVRGRDDVDYSWCMNTQKPFYLPEFGISGENDRGVQSDGVAGGTETELQATTFSTGLLAIRSQSSAKIKLEFLPLLPGNYKCQLLLLDENIGEFMYEIHAVAHLPPSLETMEFQCEAGALNNGAARFRFLRELIIPAKNPLLNRALTSFVERATGHMKLKLKEGLKKCEESHHSHFSVEFNSPFFGTSQPELTLVPSGSNAKPGMSKASATSVGDTAPGTARTDKSNPDSSSSPMSTNKAPLKGNQARISTPRSNMPTANSVLIDFQPKGAGVYTCKLLLRSFNSACGSSDVRVYDLVAKVKEPNVKTLLEFVAPARHSIVQEIPLSNPSDTAWTLRATFATSGDGSTRESMFSGPSTLHVPAKRSASYPLTFSPKWILTEKCSFILVNPATQQQFEFELSGYGEEPLAQDHIVLSCQARTSIVREFDVVCFKTDPPGEKTFKIESDLRDVIGAPTISVPAGHAGGGTVVKYPLTFSPLVSGTYFGSITFTNTATQEYIWYTIEANVTPPEPEAALEMRTIVRDAIGVEISLVNPLNHSVTFAIEMQGNGLLGPETFSLEPNATGVYELVYSPLIATGARGDPNQPEQGAILFAADEIGQFWYRLLLVAEPAVAQSIDDMVCAVGDVCSQPIWLQNPSDRELALQFRISNTRNFSIKGASTTRSTVSRTSTGSSTVLLSPFGKASVVVEYTPSSLSEFECASIVFFEPGIASDWEFNVRGKGRPPSVMKPILVSAKVGEATSTLFTFKNPFAETLRIEIKLGAEPDAAVVPSKPDAAKAATGGVFDMLLKKNVVNLEAFGHLQVPISFFPRVVSESHAEIIIRGSDEYAELEWRYPIHGIAEAPLYPRPIVLACQARDSIEKIVMLELLASSPSLRIDEELFTVEWEIVPERFGVLATTAAIERALSATPLPREADDVNTSTLSLPYGIRFEPLRPFRGSVNLLLKKQSGGFWRYEVVLETSDPPVDDTITIESSLNQTSSVTFQLRNQFRHTATFNAEFSAGSSAAFSVYPGEGLLPPYGSHEGQPFVVSFTPTGYGKMQSGQLLITTEEMQWTFNVKGTYPDASSKGSRSSSGPGSSLSSSASLTRLGISKATSSNKSRGTK